MEIRDASMPDDAEWPTAGDPPIRAAGLDEPPPAPPTEVSFRVDGRLTAIRVAGAVIFLLLALAFHDDRGRLLFAAVAGVVCAGYAVRDLVVPRRLTADAEGITVVSGLGRRRRLAWDQIEGVRREERRRLGTRSDLLEIDAGDDLYLFSGYDLGVPCWQAAETLEAIAPPR